MFADFRSITEIIKKFKSVYGFEERCLNIRDVCMDFEPRFKVYNLVSVHPKSIKLGQMTTLNVIFHVVVSVYRLVEIWNSPQFPAQFRNGLWLIANKAILKKIALITNEKVIFASKKKKTLSEESVQNMKITAVPNSK